LMFTALARFLANVADASGTLLMLDDMQWAGADALEVLAYLLQSAHERPLRVVSAYRDTEVRPQDPFDRARADLAHQGLIAQAVLRPLPPEEARELLADLLGEGDGGASAQATLREQALERAEGVPLFLVSYAQELRAGTLKAPLIILDGNSSTGEGS